MFYMNVLGNNFENNKYSEIKKIGSNALRGDFPLRLFVSIYLMCSKIGTEKAQIHLQAFVYNPRQRIY